MQSLLGKNIVVGVTGSIAAYKSAELIRRLRDAGAETRVVMTRGACEFITPLTLQTLSGHPVAIELLDADEESAMGHIALARWADWVLVAPASADFIARLANGRADDLLAALSLATESPIAIAPAMNNKMWSNTATTANLSVLRDRGIAVLGPGSGDQACGEQGEGRLLEPVAIVAELAHLVLPPVLKGKRILVTAGPTYEAIDPVRFIGNRSSGKMGFALAQAAAEAGADVTLIAGPVHLATPSGVKRLDVESSAQMQQAVSNEVKGVDIFISCAAVADYRPVRQLEHKIKKTGATGLVLELEETQDIVASVKRDYAQLFVVGFAAETDNLTDYARQKMSRKGLDMIAANQVGNGLAFGSNQNQLHVIWPEGDKILPMAAKSQLARDLMTLIIEQYYAKNTTQNS